MGFSSCAHGPSRSGTRVSLLCGMWNLPGPGIKPMSPGLQGRFLTPGPPREAPIYFLIWTGNMIVDGCLRTWSQYFDVLTLEMEKAMAPHSSALAWKIPWMEEPGRLQSMRSLRVGHNWATSLSRIREGNGNPLQCSCLENPRAGGAWWAAVYGVAQSRTRLKQLSSSSSNLGDSNRRYHLRYLVSVRFCFCCFAECPDIEHKDYIFKSSWQLDVTT